MRYFKKQQLYFSALILGALILFGFYHFANTNQSILPPNFQQPVIEGLESAGLYDPSQDTLSFEPITLGQTDALTFKIKIEDRLYFVKIFDPNIAGYINETAISMTKYADTHNIGPKFYYAPEDRSFMITEFFLGRPLTGEEARNPEMIKKIAKALRVIHDYPVSRHDVTYITFLDKIINSMNQTFGKKDGLKKRFKNSYQTASKIYTLISYHSPLALTHNDFHNDNVFYDGKRLAIFDWDDSGVDSPYLDIGRFFTHNALTRQEKETFFEAYSGKEQINNGLALSLLAEKNYTFHQALKFYRLYVNTQESTLKEKALKYLDKFEMSMKSSQLQEAIKILEGQGCISP